MLERQLERIAQKLAQQIVEALLQLDIDEVAALLPVVKVALRDAQKASPAPVSKGAGPASKGPASKAPVSKGPASKAPASKAPASTAPVSKGAASRAPEAKSGESKSAPVKSGESKSSPVKSGESKSAPVKSGEAKSGEAKSGEAKSGEAKSGEAKSGEVPPSSRTLHTGKGPGRALKPKRVSAITGAELRDALLSLLANQPQGLRSEEIQLALDATTLDLRAALAALVSEGLVRRDGQARGTRYSPASVPTPAAAVAKPVPPPPPTRRAPRPAPAPEPEPPAVEVSTDDIDHIRRLLADSIAMPLTAADIEAATKLSRDRVRATLDRMVSLGLVERESHGPAPRFKLSTGGRGGGDGARVVRRRPGAKAWQVASGEQPPEEKPGSLPSADEGAGPRVRRSWGLRTVTGAKASLYGAPV